MEQLSLFVNCDPCSYFFKIERSATKELGWDLAPVCDWHALQSWVSPPMCGAMKEVITITKVMCDNVFPCQEHGEG